MPRYVNTKLMVVTTSGDEFFIPDDSSYYWKDLQQITNGTVLMRKIPNAEHSCVGHQSAIFADLVSFYLSAYEKQVLVLFRPQNIFQILDMNNFRIFLKR